MFIRLGAETVLTGFLKILMLGFNRKCLSIPFFNYPKDGKHVSLFSYNRFALNLAQTKSSLWQIKDKVILRKADKHQYARVNYIHLYDATAHPQILVATLTHQGDYQFTIERGQ